MIHKKTSRNVKEILKPADDESEEYLPEILHQVVLSKTCVIM